MTRGERAGVEKIKKKLVSEEAKHSCAKESEPSSVSALRKLEAVRVPGKMKDTEDTGFKRPKSCRPPKTKKRDSRQKKSNSASLQPVSPETRSVKDRSHKNNVKRTKGGEGLHWKGKRRKGKNEQQANLQCPPTTSAGQ